MRVSELQTSKLTDRNPKDLIIYPESDFVFMDHSSQRDNNGRGFFDDAPFPTLEFPSDHAFLTCELNLRRRNFSDPEHMPWEEELPDGMPWNRKGPIEFDPVTITVWRTELKVVSLVVHEMCNSKTGSFSKVGHTRSTTVVMK